MDKMKTIVHIHIIILKVFDKTLTAEQAIEKIRKLLS